MNQRIKELARQARILSDQFQEQWKAGPSNEEFFQEKFAELIVQKCMDIARQVGNISDPDDFALDRCYEIEQRIQDHFGVI